MSIAFFANKVKFIFLQFLRPVREMIKKYADVGFPTKQIFNHFKGTNRALQFSDDDISNLLYSKYGNGDTLVVLSILYPWADLRHNFHIDHMFPKSEFTAKKLRLRGVPEEKINEFIANYNYIGNLQLLEEIPNIEKSAMDFDAWLRDKIPVDGLSDYKVKNYIPNVNLSFPNFDIFLEGREDLLIQKLKTELQF